MFRVEIPLDQATTTSNGPLVYKANSGTLYSINVNFTASSVMWIDIPQTCGSTGCTAGSTVSLLFQNMFNPNFFSANSATDSWKIYTMTSTYEYIDGISSGIIATPSLIGMIV